MNITVFSSPLRERESKIYFGQTVKRKPYIIFSLRKMMLQLFRRCMLTFFKVFSITKAY